MDDMIFFTFMYLHIVRVGNVCLDFQFPLRHAHGSPQSTLAHAVRKVIL